MKRIVAIHNCQNISNHRLLFVFISPWFTSFCFWFELLHYVRCILIGIISHMASKFIVNIDVTKWHLLQHCCCFFRVCVWGVGRKFWQPPLTPGVGYKGRILHSYLSKYLFRLREKTTSYQKCLERERIRCLSVHKALHKIMHTANHRLRFVFVSPWFTSFRFWFELLHYVRCILIGIISYG